MSGVTKKLGLKPKTASEAAEVFQQGQRRVNVTLAPPPAPAKALEDSECITLHGTCSDAFLTVTSPGCRR